MIKAADIGIDLGTSSVLVYIRGKGIVLKEPSVVAFDRDLSEIREIGEEARKMIGRTPGNIVAIRPLKQGVISDYDMTEKMLKYFIRKAVGRSFFGRKHADHSSFLRGRFGKGNHYVACRIQGGRRYIYRQTRVEQSSL